MSIRFSCNNLRLPGLVAPLAILFLVGSVAFAAEQSVPTLQDVQIVARVLGFQATPPVGALTLAIVFNPADAASVDETKVLVALLADGLTSGSITLHARAVPQGDLTHLDDVGAVLSTDGVDGGALRPALQRLRVPCLTFDWSQVEDGACMVAVRSTPSVAILLNQTAAAAGGVQFATAFRMMVQER